MIWTIWNVKIFRPFCSNYEQKIYIYGSISSIYISDKNRETYIMACICVWYHLKLPFLWVSFLEQVYVSVEKRKQIKTV